MIPEAEGMIEKDLVPEIKYPSEDFMPVAREDKVFNIYFRKFSLLKKTRLNIEHVTY